MLPNHPSSRYHYHIMALSPAIMETAEPKSHEFRHQPTLHPALIPRRVTSSNNRLMLKSQIPRSRLPDFQIGIPTRSCPSSTPQKRLSSS
ncbi:hypothetical protein DL95DRAFT_392771 [Leptodontidium sp. 2 PMI_412]|nr:hypothetical protein DL95DRAFT_392771 [Leptodontidium sp. 2 PMI_412]